MSDNQRVGVGFLAVTHPHVYTRADILRGMDGVELVAVWDDEDDANAETFAARYGAERIAAREQLLARDDVDAVIVESWTQRQADNAIAALRAGKHVLLEKPGGNDVAAISAVADAVRETDGYLTVGYMVRQNDTQERLKRLLASGALGRLTVGRFHVSVPAPDPVTPWFNLEDDLGGVLFEDGCHMIDLVVDLFGPPGSVTAQILKWDDLAHAHGHRYEDAAVCTMAWPSFVATMSLVGWEANDWLETWEIALFGDNGSVFAGPLPERVHVFLKEARDELPAGWTRHDTTQFNVSWLDHDAEHVWHAVQHRAFYRAELERFVADIRGGGVPEIPASHAVDVTRTLAALYEAARTGGTVAL